MLKKIKTIFADFAKGSSRGMTLIELIVSIAILAIVSSVLVSSYTNVMEDQRMQSDLSKLNEIDVTLKQILLYDDVFEEIKPLVYDKNKLKISFKLTTLDGGHKAKVVLSDATLNDSGELLKDKCEILYEYLTEYVGQSISLDSASFKGGYYRIYITFNGTQVSEIRDYTITNDTVTVTNSGGEEMYQHE